MYKVNLSFFNHFIMSDSHLHFQQYETSKSLLPALQHPDDGLCQCKIHVMLNEGLEQGLHIVR